MSVNLSWATPPGAEDPLLPVTGESEWHEIWSGLDESRFKVLRETLPLYAYDAEEKKALLEDLALCRELIPKSTLLYERLPRLITVLRENMDAEHWHFG